MISSRIEHGVVGAVVATAISLATSSAAANATPAGYGNGVAADDLPPLHDNLGDYSRQITTIAAEAQAYFDQGLRLGYGFARADAARSFRAAQERDPDCAMCYWGEAWALGPYQNNPAGVGEPADARRAAAAALQRVEGVDGWEQALIEAMVARYPDEADNAFATEEYAAAMAEAAAAHPTDPDVGTLHGEALMMFRPWDLHRTVDEQVEPYPESAAAIQALEAVLADDLAHPGACHLYIHAVEAWEPWRAADCADRLGETIPGVSHIQHMPSHIYVHIGRFGDAVRANQAAVKMDRAAEYDAGFSVYAGHNMGMLAFAAWLDGQSGVSLTAARDMGRLDPEDAFHYDLKLARFGRWAEILDRDVATDDDFQGAIQHFARGLAELREGDREAADAALATIREVRAKTAEDAVYGFFGHLEVDLLGVAEHILAGEIAATDGRVDEAVSHLREAIALEDGFPYAEPEPWHLPARHVLGAVLLEADRPEAAEAVYREALEAHPGNGWSLRGLEQSLAAQGRQVAAAEAAEAFAEAWQRADIWLPASRF